MRWMATDLSQECYHKVTSLRSFIRVNKIRIFESYLDQHLNSSIRPTGCQAARRQNPIWTPTRHLGLEQVDETPGKGAS